MFIPLPYDRNMISVYLHAAVYSPEAFWYSNTWFWRYEMYCVYVSPLAGGSCDSGALWEVRGLEWVCFQSYNCSSSTTRIEKRWWSSTSTVQTTCTNKPEEGKGTKIATYPLSCGFFFCALDQCGIFLKFGVQLKQFNYSMHGVN